MPLRQRPPLSSYDSLPTMTSAMIGPVLRFAPSPTGHLHIGNARIAVLNGLYAQSQGGKMLLRIDDSDKERSQDVFTESILADLKWLAIEHAPPLYQSQRMRQYQDAFHQLIALGRLYPCFETEEELARKRIIARKQGRPPVYDRAALQLTTQQKNRFEKEGRKPYWRFQLRSAQIHWQDMIFQDHYHPLSQLSDPVLVRADGVPLFTLSSVVDDIAMNISHILRGEDHMTNTAVQIELFDALQAPPPQFGHLPLLTDGRGKPFSKREQDSLTLKHLRSTGYEAQTILSLLATLGSTKPITIASTWNQLCADFDIHAFSRNAAKADENMLKDLNRQWLRAADYHAVKTRLHAIDSNISEEFWHAIRNNITTLSDSAKWAQICFHQLALPISNEDTRYVQLAATLLPEPPWNHETWGVWCRRLKAKTERQGKQLFLPLRRALTHEDDGPEMSMLLPFIGFERAKHRLLQKP